MKAIKNLHLFAHIRSFVIETALTDQRFALIKLIKPQRINLIRAVYGTVLCTYVAHLVRVCIYVDIY